MIRRALFGILVLTACDENKYEKMAQQAAASASASAAAMASASAAVPSAIASALPPPKKKREFKCDDTTAVVDFHGDKVMEADVRLKLGNGKEPKKGDVTKADLANVKSLNLTKDGNKVDDLDPCVMPNFKGLKDLFIGSGDLDDLTPIQTLTQLWSLRASGTQVKDLKPVSHLTQLDRLDMSRTPIADLDPIKTLTVLTELQLDDTQVEDLTPLASLKKLQKLHLRNTRVKNLTPLKDLRELQLLEIQGSPATDTSPLTPLVAHGLKIKMGAE